MISRQTAKLLDDRCACARNWRRSNSRRPHTSKHQCYQHHNRDACCSTWWHGGLCGDHRYNRQANIERTILTPSTQHSSLEPRCLAPVVLVQ